MLPIIRRAATIVGNGKPNLTLLAKKIGAPRTAFYTWSRIPGHYCIKIYKATKGAITLNEMRKDLYDKDMTP